MKRFAECFAFTVRGAGRFWCRQDTGFFLLRGVVRNVHIHQANLTALPAACALCFVELHAEKGKTAHWHQKDGDKGEGVCKYSTPEPAEKESFAALWDLPGKKVQHHRRPAGPVAPSLPKRRGRKIFEAAQWIAAASKAPEKRSYQKPSICMFSPQKIPRETSMQPPTGSCSMRLSMAFCRIRSTSPGAPPM